MDRFRMTSPTIRIVALLGRGLLCASLAMLTLSPAIARHMPVVEPDVPPTALLSGQWAPVDSQMGGQDYPLANFNGARLRLIGARYEFGNDRGSYTIVYAGSPSRLDIHVESGPNADRTIPVLYLLAGDELTVAYQMGPGVRPKDFTSPPGSKILVVHFRRAH